jgi:hypothetical protein
LNGKKLDSTSPSKDSSKVFAYLDYRS